MKSDLACASEERRYRGQRASYCLVSHRRFKQKHWRDIEGGNAPLIPVCQFVLGIDGVVSWITKALLTLETYLYRE